VPGRERDVAEAYLHLGIAYATLGQPSPARSQFIQALRRDPTLTLDPATASPAALEAFATARQEGLSEGVVPSRPKKKMGTGTKVLIAGGAVGVGAAVAVAGAQRSARGSDEPIPTFVPLTTSPYIQLLSANPGPGSVFSASQGVSLTVRSQNVGTADLRFVFVGESLTSDGRICFAGNSGLFSYGPNGTITATFSLSARCTPPFTTDRLAISLQDPDTDARPYSAVYSGRLQATQ
jgi:hypothetical protein